MQELPDHWTPGAASLQALSDDQFLATWHECVLSDDKQRLALIEGSARQRFSVGDWREHYVRRYREQTLYSAME